MIHSASIPAIVMSVVVLITAANRFIIYYHRRFREDLSFAASSLIFCAYAAASAGLYSANAPMDGAVWQRTQLCILGILTPALLWFFLEYTGQTLSPARFVLLGAPSPLLGLVNSLWPGAWTVSATDSAVKHVKLLFGHSVTYNEMAMGSLVTLQLVSCFVVIICGGCFIWRMGQNETGSRFRYLLTAYLFFSVTAVADALVGEGIVALPYTMEYGFFALIVFMGFQSAGELSRSADIELSKRKYEARYSQFVNASSDGICMVRFREQISTNLPPDAQVDAILRSAYLAECNRALANMYGIPLPTLLLNMIISLWSKSPMKEQREITAKFVRAGYHLVEYESCEKDFLGRSRWFINNLHGIVEKSVLTCIWAAKREVTEIKTVSERIRQSEERYRAFVANSSEAIWRFEFDPPLSLDHPPAKQVDLILNQSVWAEANDAFMAMYKNGQSKRVPCSKLSDVFDPTDSTTIEVFTRLVSSSYRLKECTVRRRLSDGAVRWYACSMSGVIENNRLCRLWGAQRDITALRQTSDALAESEARFRLIADHVEDIFWILDPHTDRITYVSPAFERTWGISCEAIYRNRARVMDAVHPDDRARVGETFSRHPVFPSESIKYRIVRPDGSIRWIWTQAFHVVDEHNQTQCFVGTSSDITSMVDSMSKIREGEARYRDLFENTGTLMGIINDDMTMSVVNSEWLRFGNYKREQVENRMRITDFVPESERAMICEYHRARRLTPDSVPRSYEMHFTKADGTNVPVLATVSLIPMTQLSVLSLIDISGLKRVEEELRESQQMLRMILDNVPQRIFWKDENSVILGCNSRFAGDFGFDNTIDLIGMTDDEFTSVQTEAEHYRRCDRQVLQTGKPLKITETHTKADGTVAYLETNKLPILDADGVARRVLGTYEDITERVVESG